jgi:DNA-directed RNA polymerase subunit M/transcription elongation factor TFIIS
VAAAAAAAAAVDAAAAALDPTGVKQTLHLKQQEDQQRPLHQQDVARTALVDMLMARTPGVSVGCPGCPGIPGIPEGPETPQPPPPTPPLTEREAHDAEVGVFNWAIAKAEERRIACNWGNPRFRMVYAAKARSVAANLDAAGYVGNDRLLRRLRDGEFLPHEVASMHPENVHPERWHRVVEAKVRRDEYISTAKPMAMTDQFRCGRCKKRECSYMELQMRSCDEPASLFIQCISCGHRWRMG